ncbi:MAG TPA: phospho-sugar mutase, partial [Streptosporangiaceae bacterium]|nr:phospho-sugar mutase [Streptosporangiaceae bacterium]
MAVEAGLRARVEAWIADDPDPADRAELRGLLERAGSDAGAAAELRDRFAGRLAFGTAGLRGAVAAGPNRMNRAVVRAATAAVAGWLAGQGGRAGGPGGPGPSGARAGVVVGCDARHRSAEFADEAARVLAGAGIAVHLLPAPCPTPLLAFGVRHLGAAAGVMITASHNPAADNGYKLYLGDGAQVIPPVDAEVERRMAGLGPLSRVPVASAASPLIARCGDEVARAYLDAVVAAAGPPPPGAAKLKVVYTPMHGVAGPLLLRAAAAAGYAPPHLVAAQAEPDPDFPTVAFPNPEEPGALDAALADARRLGADLVLASDPDGDRLAVAVPARPGRPSGSGGVAGSPEGGASRGGSAAAGWVALTGDQVGALLGAGLLRRTAAWGGSRLVASTIVSSTLLAKVAAAAGAQYAQTLTGFKWIARAADGRPGARFVFGYEEALGYAVGDVVRDKDGIGAALEMLRLAAEAAAAGRPVLALYDDLETAHGVHLTAQVAQRTAEVARVMARLRSAPPRLLGGQPVTGVTDLAAAGQAGLPPADVLVFLLPGARVVVRPSGTEPKLKVYIDASSTRGDSRERARDVAERLATLETGMHE